MVVQKKDGGDSIPIYSNRYFSEKLPRLKLPNKSSSARACYQLIKDELNLDGKATLNLASFVTTWMEPEAIELICATLNENFADRDQYPMAQKIQERCIHMIADLFSMPKNAKFAGTSTIGSSEAVMLSGLAQKWRWRKKNPNRQPNIVMSSGVQVVWHKFARYFDVTPKFIPMQKNRYTINGKDLEKYVDRDTICVVANLGITETGQFDPVEELNQTLEKINRKHGWDVPLHIDAASGGFIAPFIYPKFKWDFRLSQVRSINVSGHKYGLVYPGIGWAIWKNAEDIPEDLVFHINYLGGKQPTFTLNFSKSSSHVIAQYYNFLRLGKDGYKQVAESLMIIAHYIRKELEKTKLFVPINTKEGLPVVTMRMRKGPTNQVFKIAEEIRKKGWIIPAYMLPPNAESIAVFRIVVREGLSQDMAKMLVEDIVSAHKKIKSRSKTKQKTSKTKEHRVC